MYTVQYMKLKFKLELELETEPGQSDSTGSSQIPRLRFIIALIFKSGLSYFRRFKKHGRKWNPKKSLGNVMDWLAVSNTVNNLYCTLSTVYKMWYSDYRYFYISVRGISVSDKYLQNPQRIETDMDPITKVHLELFSLFRTILAILSFLLHYTHCVLLIFLSIFFY